MSLPQYRYPKDSADVISSSCLRRAVSGRSHSTSGVISCSCGAELDALIVGADSQSHQRQKQQAAVGDHYLYVNMQSNNWPETWCPNKQTLSLSAGVRLAARDVRYTGKTVRDHSRLIRPWTMSPKQSEPRLHD